MSKKNITEKEYEIKLPIPIKNLRISSEELKKIKDYSDENFSLLIYSLLSFMIKEDVEKIFEILEKENDLKEPYDLKEKNKITEIIILTEDDNKREKIINFLIEKYSEEQNRNFIVNLVAIIDHYIHELVIWGIIQITQNKFPKGKLYNKFSININFLKSHFEEGKIDEKKLRKDIINRLSRVTYQRWDKIIEALYLIFPNEICNKLDSLTKKEDKLFNVIDYDKILKERNRIVHSFDRNIEKDSCRNICNYNCGKYFNLIKKIIKSLHQIAEEYDETQPENPV